jgi:hypothetical protein
MEIDILKIVGQIAGIGGIAFGVFLLLFREVIRKNIFPTLTKEQSYRILRLLLVLTFFIGLTGVGAWIFITWTSVSKTSQKPDPSAFLKSLGQPDYLESFDFSDVGPESIWSNEEDDIWSSKLDQGQYCLSNTDGQRAVRYIHLGLKDRDISSSPVSVEVVTQQLDKSDPLSSGGLMYRFDLDKKTYYAFTISNNGHFNFYKRDATGFSKIYTERSPIIHKDGFNKLTIMALGNRFSLYINDSLARVIEDEALKSGVSGIIAMSPGQYCFDNFAIYKEVKSRPE